MEVFEDGSKQTNKQTFVSTALTDEGLAKGIHLEIRDRRTSRTASSLQDEKQVVLFTTLRLVVADPAEYGLDPKKKNFERHKVPKN